MSKQKKILSPVLYPFSRDMTKRWFVEWNDKNGISKRIWIDSILNESERLREFERIKTAVFAGLDYKKESVKKEIQLNQSVSKRLYSVFKSKEHLKKKSKQDYSVKIRLFDKWLKDRGYTKLTEAVAIDFLNHLTLIGRKPQTVNNYRRVLKHFVQSLVSSRNLKSTAFDKTKKIRGGGAVGREYYKPAQKIAIKEYFEANYPALWLACKFVYYCYVRNGNELVNLKVSDIDLNLKRLKIDSDNSKNGFCEVVVIPAAFYKELLAMDLHKYPQSHYLIGKNGLPTSERVSNGYWGKIHKIALDRMGFDRGGKRYSMYSWKNTGVVDSYKVGIGIKDIQAQLRHKSLDTTYLYLKCLGLFDNDDTFDKIASI